LSIDVNLAVKRNENRLVWVAGIKVDWDVDCGGASEGDDRGGDGSGELLFGSDKALVALSVGGRIAAGVLEFAIFVLEHLARILQILQLLHDAVVSLHILAHVARGGEGSGGALRKWLSRSGQLAGLVSGGIESGRRCDGVKGWPPGWGVRRGIAGGRCRRRRGGERGGGGGRTESRWHGAVIMITTRLDSVPSDGDRTNRGGVTGLNLKVCKHGDDVTF